LIKSKEQKEFLEKNNLDPIHLVLTNVKPLRPSFKKNEKCKDQSKCSEFNDCSFDLR
jgi:hypothetical protein